MESIVSVQWLAKHINDQNLRIVDCRFVLGNPDAGREAYEERHIPNSIYLDLERDLSAPIGKHGGRHPLPDMQDFAANLGKSGIGNDTIVIAYDDQGGPYASRLWWMLTYMGHKHVAILDGGYSEWVKAGHPVTRDVSEIHPTTFTPNIQSNMLVDMETVKASIGKAGLTILDSRDAKRYHGEEEPIDPVAGHVPSAVNFFWKGVHTESGQWKTDQDLQEHFAVIPPEHQVIVYCGSGVTACPNVLSLQKAGYKNVCLYAGSWSDWCSYPENPVEKM